MNRFVEKIFLLLGAALFALALHSCLNSDDEKLAKTTDINRFYVYSDSVSVTKYTFSIDRENYFITNADSLPYGTPIHRLYPVFTPTFYSVRVNDEAPFYQSDTSYFNFTEPLRFTVTASDRKTSATYTVKVNVHQVDPDSFIWVNIADQIIDAKPKTQSVCYLNGKFFHFANVDNSLIVSASDNGSDWNRLSLSGLDSGAAYDIKNVAYSDDMVFLFADNTLYSSSDGEKWTVVSASGLTVSRLLFCLDGKLYAVADNAIARLDDGQWVKTAELPKPFPVKGEAITVAESYSGKARAFVIGGVDEKGDMLSTVWSTETGDYWINLTEGNSSLSPITNAATVQYNSMLYLVGGEDNAGNLVEGVSTSTDFGMNWVANDSTKLLLPQAYGARKNAAVISTPEGFIYLIGGETADGEVKTDVIRGLDFSALPGFKR